MFAKRPWIVYFDQFPVGKISTFDELTFLRKLAIIISEFDRDLFV